MRVGEPCVCVCVCVSEWGGVTSPLAATISSLNIESTCAAARPVQCFSRGGAFESVGVRRWGVCHGPSGVGAHSLSRWLDARLFQIGRAAAISHHRHRVLAGGAAAHLVEAPGRARHASASRPGASAAGPPERVCVCAESLLAEWWEWAAVWCARDERGGLLGARHHGVPDEGRQRRHSLERL